MKHDKLNNLIQLIKSLRNEETGCAWTRAQDFESLAPLTIEETYELTDAIQTKDPESIKNELGDLLYHIVFYAHIAEEKGLFNFNDIAKVMLEKHKSRMPKEHKHYTAEDINLHWKKHKAKKEAGHLSSIEPSLPPTIRAYLLQSKASEVGFDWDDKIMLLEKIHEEVLELQHELAIESESISSEIGDLIFCCINLIRHLGLHPENVIAAANQKFISRFNYMEEALKKENKSLQSATQEEMEMLWKQAKEGEKNHGSN